MGKIWNWTNGHKRQIGGSILLLALLVDKAAGIWGASPDSVHGVVSVLEWLGGIVTGAGLGHAGVKTVTGAN